jgi:hypothetical protein
MAAAALAGLQLEGDDKYRIIFRRAHNWFLGKNSLEQPMVNVAQGACFDGLQACGINKNQGAESTLAYLWTQWHSSLADKVPIAAVGRSRGSSAPTF